MQGGADADHTRTQDYNIGLQFRHPALRKLNVTHIVSLLMLKLVIAASPRKPVTPAESRLRSGQVLATWNGDSS
jgi:hypothetical protein